MFPFRNRAVDADVIHRNAGATVGSDAARAFFTGFSALSVSQAVAPRPVAVRAWKELAEGWRRA